MLAFPYDTTQGRIVGGWKATASNRARLLTALCVPTFYHHTSVTISCIPPLSVRHTPSHPVAKYPTCYTKHKNH